MANNNPHKIKQSYNIDGVEINIYHQAEQGMLGGYELMHIKGKEKELFFEIADFEQYSAFINLVTKEEFESLKI